MTKYWVNRIKEFGYKHASQFIANPKNWRIHPEMQRRAVEGSIESLGIIDVIIENANTGFVIDGHERVWQALKNDDAILPYIRIDLDESQEAQAILSIDGIMGMAEMDKAKVQQLANLIQTESDKVNEVIEIILGRVGILNPDIEKEDLGEDPYASEIRIKVDRLTFKEWEELYGNLPGELDEEKLNALLDTIEGDN